MKRILIAIKLTLFSMILALSCTSCGSKGSSDTPQSTTAPGTVGGGTVSQNPKDVTAQFFLESPDNPALDFDVWVIDHTSVYLSRYPLSSSGQLKIPIDKFTAGHVYSFHLVTSSSLLASIDLSSALPGMQAAVKYQGGYGFNLGSFILKKDALGRLQAESNVLQGAVGGGFSIEASQDGSLTAFGLPNELSSYVYGNQLLVFDPVTLLQSFHRRGNVGSSYARDLLAHSRVKIALQGRSDHALIRAFVVEGGSWLAASRLASSEQGERSQAPLWSASNFELTKGDTGLFEASVFTSSVLPPNSLLLLKIQAESGPLLSLPVIFSRSFATPPLVSAISLSGSAPLNIDYSATESDNGLTSPFCLNGHDVAVRLNMPLDQAGLAWIDDEAPFIDAEFDYYTTNELGHTHLVIPAATDFPPSFQAGYSQKIDSNGYHQSWFPGPHPSLLRHEAPLSNAALSSHVFTIPSAVFLNSANGSNISRIRVRLYTRWPSGSESASVLWLKKNC